MRLETRGSWSKLLPSVTSAFFCACASSSAALAAVTRSRAATTSARWSTHACNTPCVGACTWMVGQSAETFQVFKLMDNLVICCSNKTARCWSSCALRASACARCASISKRAVSWADRSPAFNLSPALFDNCKALCESVFISWLRSRAASKSK